MFDRMGRQFGGADMPMTSYAGNNALGGLAAAQMGQGGMGQAMNRFQGRFPQMPQMQPPAAPQFAPGEVPPGAQSALAGMGGAAPLVFNAQGLPQQFQDYQQQMTDWRGARPDRPDLGAMRQQVQDAGGWQPGMFQQMRDQFKDQRMDYRNQMQDWRGQRPQFAGWR